MPNILEKRKWDDAYFNVIYEHAREGLDDEEIAERMEVPLHVLRRWIRTKDALKAMLASARPAIHTPGDATSGVEVDADGSELEPAEGLAQIYHEFSHLKPPMKKNLLICFAQTGVISHAARAAGTSRENHYRWLREDPEYAELFERLQPLAVGRLEDQALTHAMYGMRRYKFNHAGSPVMVRCDPSHPEAVVRTTADGDVYHVRHYYEDEFSPSLQIFMLKCWRPDRYRDKPIELNANIGVGMGLNLNQLLEEAERNNVINVEAVDARAAQLIEEHSAQ